MSGSGEGSAASRWFKLDRVAVANHALLMRRFRQVTTDRGVRALVMGQSVRPVRGVLTRPPPLMLRPGRTGAGAGAVG